MSRLTNATAAAILLMLLTGASRAEDASLVADIDTTGDPLFFQCDTLCPPPEPEYGGLPHQLTPWNGLLFP